jgi:hypothetical protein
MNKILSRPADKIETLPDALHRRINDLLNNPVYSNRSSLALANIRSSLDNGPDAASAPADGVLVAFLLGSVLASTVPEARCWWNGYNHCRYYHNGWHHS